jgi:hypothetical protein
MFGLITFPVGLIQVHVWVNSVHVHNICLITFSSGSAWRSFYVPSALFRVPLILGFDLLCITKRLKKKIATLKQ